MRNQYNEALKYFNTLVKYFPNSQEVQDVKFSILESYFGKQDYESVEALAKRLLAEKNIPADMLEKITRRKAEAIFLRAQQLSDSGSMENAADEYHRLALEAPSVDFADRAPASNMKSWESTVKRYRFTSGSVSLITDRLWFRMP